MIGAQKKSATQYAEAKPHEHPLKKTWEERPGSRIGACLREGKKVFSIEVLPPKGLEVARVMEQLRKIDEAGIDFVNIPDGARASTRVSSLHLSSFIANRPEIKLSAVPHFTSRDRNLIALQSDLLGAALNGVKDILLVTGDPPKLGNNKEASAVYDVDSIGLTHLVECLNRGVSPKGETLGKGFEMGIGVASNPTASNLELEHKRFGYKCEMGADFTITQPIFDPDAFLRWRDSLKNTCIIPHIVGIWPLISYRNAEFLANEVPGVLVPRAVLEKMERVADDKEASLQVGLDIARDLMQKIEKSCDGFCISAPLGKVNLALQLIA
jgi:homocysteine S-methyltransferase